MIVSTKISKNNKKEKKKNKMILKSDKQSKTQTKEVKIQRKTKSHEYLIKLFLLLQRKILN